MNNNEPVDETRDLGLPIKVQSRDPEAMKPALTGLLQVEFPDRHNLRVTSVAPPSGAGVNNETMLIDMEWQADGQICAEGAVLRIDTPDNLFLEPHFPDHYRLYDVIRRGGYAPVPKVFGFNADESIFGRRFFFMQRMPGKVPADQPPFHAEGWVKDKSVGDRRAIWENAVRAMAALHTVKLDDVAFLDRPQSGRSGFEQELTHFLHYMEVALGGESHRVIEAGAQWLKDNLPGDMPTGFSWGDARPQNIIFDGNEVSAVLDWDMASLAGAEADLAWWTLMSFSGTSSRGIPRLEGWGSPAETIALWEDIAGRKARHMDYQFVFTAFRGGVIVMRLAKMLIAKGQLPEASHYLRDNNHGIQYLASLLGLEPMREDSLAWPGLD